MMRRLKRCVIVAAIALFICAGIFVTSGICQDETVKVFDETVKAFKEGDETTAMMINNSSCPVSDDDIVKGEAVMVEYKGKIYNLCCEACVKHFKKFPEKFALKLASGR